MTLEQTKLLNYIEWDLAHARCVVASAMRNTLNGVGTTEHLSYWVGKVDALEKMQHAVERM